MKPVATAQWQVADGRRLYARELNDTQLKLACNIGLRSAQKQFQEEALDNLAAAAGGDDGLSYLAEVQSEAATDRASDVRELVRRMAQTLRFREVLVEMRRRRVRQQASMPQPA